MSKDHALAARWLGAAALTLLLASCDAPNVERRGLFDHAPKPGYAWVDPNSWSLDVRWVPGTRHPHHPNVVAHMNPDHWHPEPGYRWRSATEGLFADLGRLATGMGSSGGPPRPEPPRASGADLETEWQPGVPHPAYPHVTSSRAPGEWQPDLGYRFVAANRLDVVWQPGILDPNRPHRISARQEGSWELEPGYAESDGLFGRVVHWNPGQPHPWNNCLRAAQTEGNWEPLAGYRLTALADGRLQIRSTGADWTGVAIGAAIFLLGHSAAAASEGDGLLASGRRAALGEVGDAGGDFAARSLAGGRCDGVVLEAGWRRSGG